MYEVVWTFSKKYTKEQWEALHCSEQNDVVYLGYSEIQADRDAADGCDDFHLEFKIHHDEQAS